MRKLLKFFASFLLCLIPLSSYAQVSKGKLSAHTKLLSSSLAETTHAYLTVNKSILDREALESLGVKICVEAGKYMTVTLPTTFIAQLADVEGVEYVEVGTAAQLMMDVARVETGGEMLNLGINLPKPYTGKGVVVGIVDFGFDYTHAAFRDANGNLRIKRVWEQGGAANAESLNTKTRNTKSSYSQQSTVNSQQSTVAYGKEL